MAASPARQRPEASGQSPEEIRREYPEFARRLLDRRNEILGRDRETRANLDDQILTAPGDAADASVVDTSADYFLSLADSHRRELVEISDALDRMHRGVYGICEICEEPIAIERLRRLPTTRTCVDCQSARERAARVRPVPKL